MKQRQRPSISVQAHHGTGAERDASRFPAGGRGGRWRAACWSRGVLRTSVLFLSLAALLACGTQVTSGSDDDDPAAGGESGEGGNTHGGGASQGGSGGAISTGGSGGEGGEGGVGGSPGCTAPASPASFEIGTGEHCFARLADGDTVPLMSGPQGGYHVWLAFGCQACEPQLHVKWGVRDPQTGEIIPQTYDSEAVIDLTGAPFRQLAGITVGMPGISWDPEAYPPLPEGTPFELWAQLIGPSGEVLDEEARELVLGPTVVWDPCAETPEAPECQTG